MNRLKLMTMMLVGFFTISLTSSIQAQEQRSKTERRQSFDQNDRRDNQGKRFHKGKHKFAKRHNRAKRAHMKSMRRMAAADGAIHPQERKMMKRHRRHMNRI